MSEATEPSDEGKAEEYRRPKHVERYGLAQHQPSLGSFVSIQWSGSAYELIREEIAQAWSDLEPRGCALACFNRIETGIKVHTFPEAKALWGQITDELYRRRINDRQRNSLHRVRDELEDHFDEHRDFIEKHARDYWNGHQFRAEGEIPSTSVSVDDVRLDAPVTDDDFVTGRVKYHLSRRPDDKEVERVVDELPLMYSLD